MEKCVFSAIYNITEKNSTKSSLTARIFEGKQNAHIDVQCIPYLLRLKTTQHHGIDHLGTQSGAGRLRLKKKIVMIRG